jgi:hypothetical protein
MLHSVVGLAAVMTSIGSILSDPAHASMLHLVTGYVRILLQRPFFRSFIFSSVWLSEGLHLLVTNSLRSNGEMS